MTGSSKNSTENCPRKSFRTQEKETRAKFNPGLSANRPSNNWALMGKALIRKQILSTNSLRKCMEISLENLYLDIWVKSGEEVEKNMLFLVK